MRYSQAMLIFANSARENTTGSMTVKHCSFIGLAVLATILFIMQPFAQAQTITLHVLPTLGPNTGHTATEAAEVLKDEFGLGALETARMLSDGGYGTVGVGQALLDVYGLDVPGSIQILEDVGSPDDKLDQALQVLAFPMAEMYAPQLWFDHTASTFPMSAQDYYDVVISYYLHFGFWPEGLPYQNQDPVTVTRNEIPTYYRAFICGERQMRIVYWWFYGWQPPCYGQLGKHHGDWERVIVILSEDATRITAVTFFQHSGWYTIFENHEGAHPIVHVGKRSHGSYHDQCYLGHGCRANLILPYECRYFGDFRNNNGREDLRLDCWEKLVALDESTPTEPWMEADANLDFTWGPDGVSTHPTRVRGDEMCSMNACKGDDCWSKWGKTQGCCISQIKDPIPSTDAGLASASTQCVHTASADALLALSISVGAVTPTSEQEYTADVNGDGKVDSRDAILILRMASGLNAPGRHTEHDALLQNFPNPFNPETWIPFQLRESSQVTIRIYSMAGHLVRELDLGYVPAGLYVSSDRAVRWDGRNEAGEPGASGTYFYTINAGNFTATKKMIIAK